MPGIGLHIGITRRRGSEGVSVCSGNGRLFNGTDEYAYIDDSGAIDPYAASNIWCISAYMKMGATGLQACLGKYILDGTDERWGFYISGASSTMLFLLSWDDETPNADQYIINSGIADTDRDWHHYLAMVDKDNDKLRLWVDGSEITPAIDIDSTKLRESPDNFLIGAGYDVDKNIDNYMNGSIRDVRIYHKDVSTDIATIMNGESVEDEIAWWCLSNANYNDLSGNGYNLTLVDPNLGLNYDEGLDYENGLDYYA